MKDRNHQKEQPYLNNIMKPKFNNTNKAATRLLSAKTYKHPKGYTGYPFLCVINTSQRVGLVRKEEVRMGIIYGSEGKSRTHMEVHFLDLDRVHHSGIDEEQLIDDINNWYEGRNAIPLNIYLAMEGYNQISQLLQKIKYLEIERIIGKFFTTNLEVINIRKRARKKPLKEKLCMK